MFITLKAAKNGAKQTGMEQVALSHANQDGTHSRFGSNRREACVGCHNKKLRCTGSRISCDRCNVQQIACIFPPSHGRRRARSNRVASSTICHSGLQGNLEKSLLQSGDHGSTAQSTHVVNQPSTSLPNLDSGAKHAVNNGSSKNTVHDGCQESVQPQPISGSGHGIASTGIQIGQPHPMCFPTDVVAAQVTASEQTSATFIGDQSADLMMSEPIQAQSLTAENLISSSSLDISQFFADFPDTPCLSATSFTTSKVHETENSNGALACSCLGDALDIVQKLDDDAFQLRTLAFDHVLKLQKWLIFHCCKPLDCDKCADLLQTYTIILIICDRVAEMFKCLSRRIKLPLSNPTEVDDPRSIETPDMTTPSSSGILPRDKAPLQDESTAQLFDSFSGDAGLTTPCNPEMFSPEFRAQYSYDEQLHMIRVLAKIQVRNFNQLLVRISELQQTQQSQARFGKIMSLIKRLQEAGASMDASFQSMLQGLVG
ncbi:hypothetical protein BGZ61DRAFT_421539 [Ilyonectria robusta]|uniref:uncharacterized protein n=1 Tax=Ilyonectria robusta TaxID=1079257 RepID=UPI001E8CB9C8|nr:uncharacterized protein BGZ61DRAFT_421539 [Ilyonectria robusta]KAH8688373.1 hypothetical protein BGZ61DRAFT_421539 [Ilyonectria robusta]